MNINTAQIHPASMIVESILLDGEEMKDRCTVADDRDGYIIRVVERNGQLQVRDQYLVTERVYGKVEIIL